MPDDHVVAVNSFGRLLPNDPLFHEGDKVCNVYKRLGVFDVDTEELCHAEIKNLVCEVPGCAAELNSVMELELHYNSIHRYTCATCHKSSPSAHLLDLHVEEAHDSFFAVQAERKPMYRCLVENCSARFSSSHERHGHCVDDHSFPPNFRWATRKVSKSKPHKPKSHLKKKTCEQEIDEDEHNQQMDVGDITEEQRTVQKAKQTRGIVFGRGNMKKSFNSSSSEWHKRATSKPNPTPLEGSQLSSDLMNSLLNEEMS